MSKVLVDRELLEQLQEKLDPHRDAVLWGDVCDALRRAQPAEAEGVKVVAYAYIDETTEDYLRTKPFVMFAGPDGGAPGPAMAHQRLEALVRLSALQAVSAERDRLRDEIEALRGQLAESQANDRTAMGYLSDVRQIVGGDDFPSMVANVARMAEIRCDGCGYMTHHREHMGCVRASMAAKEASDEPS